MSAERKNSSKLNQYQSDVNVSTAFLSLTSQKITDILKKPYDKRTSRDLDILGPLIKNIEFFREKKIKDKDLSDICKRLRYLYVPPGKNVINYGIRYLINSNIGEYGDQFYIILEGLVSVNIPIPKKELLQIQQEEEAQKRSQGRRITIVRDSNQSFLKDQAMTPAKKTIDSHGTGEHVKISINQRPSFLDQLSPKVTLNPSEHAFKPDSVSLYSEKQSKQQSQPATIFQSIEHMKSFIVNAALKPLDGFKEVASLGPGKSFGELALIQNKPRMATIRCMEGTHFATLDKYDYETSLAKIERKHMNKMIDFMMQIPCFRKWTKVSIVKFSYYLKKEKFKRNQVLYKAGDDAQKIYIIKRGEIEIIRKLPKDPSKRFNSIVGAFGQKTAKKNIINLKIGDEIDDIPSKQNFMIVGKGSMIGEEDAISESQQYSCTAKCSSFTASVFVVSKEDFLTLKSSEVAWMSVLEKALWKEKRKDADYIGDKIKLDQLKKLNQPIIYDLTDKTFEDYKQVMKEKESFNQTNNQRERSIENHHNSSIEDSTIMEYDIFEVEKRSLRKNSIGVINESNQKNRLSNMSNGNQEQLQQLNDNPILLPKINKMSTRNARGNSVGVGIFNSQSQSTNQRMQLIDIMKNSQAEISKQSPAKNISRISIQSTNTNTTTNRIKMQQAYLFKRNRNLSNQRSPIRTSILHSKENSEMKDPFSRSSMNQSMELNSFYMHQMTQRKRQRAQIMNILEPQI